VRLGLHVQRLIEDILSDAAKRASKASLERGALADCGAGRELLVLLLLQRDERSMRTQFFECRVLRIVELWILERAQIVTEMLDRIRSHYDAVDPGP